MHAGNRMAGHALTNTQKEQFVHDGFVKLECAFAPELACCFTRDLVECDRLQSPRQRDLDSPSDPARGLFTGAFSPSGKYVRTAFRI